MNKPTDEQLAKLPKWARNHINLCHSNLEHMENRVNTIFKEKEDKDSNVCIPYFFGYDGREDDLSVPDYFKLRFKVACPGYDHHDTFIEVGLDSQNKDKVRIYASHSIKVLPNSSNLIELALERR